MGACCSSNELVGEEGNMQKLAKYGNVQGQGFQPGPIDGVAAGNGMQPSVACGPAGGSVMGSQLFPGGPQIGVAEDDIPIGRPRSSKIHGARPDQLPNGPEVRSPVLRVAHPSDYFNGHTWETLSQAQAACDRYNLKFTTAPNEPQQQYTSLNEIRTVHVNPQVEPNGTWKYNPNAAVVMPPVAPTQIRTEGVHIGTQGVQTIAIQEMLPNSGEQVATGVQDDADSEKPEESKPARDSGKSKAKRKKKKSSKSKKKSSKSKKKKSSKSKKTSSKKK